ncbi:serine/threonine protein kinase [Thermomonospora amylolytica]|uniref:serine/threonine protein kinase n=1 Tax=Thermomonospora amylolytica TaxID=1411117 RepID=UPI000E6B551A|nr:serine/threonine-protein kinase [Thermomonospora amylolytica]
MPGEAVPLRAGDPRTLGGFHLIGRLAAGERGVAYLGRDPSGRAVTIHRIAPGPPARVADVVARARTVDSPYVARVLAGDTEADGAYLVSEHVRGASLAEAVGRHGPCSGEALHRLAAGTIEGLAAVHEAGLVHGGLRPETVLLGPQGPCVTDFALDALTGHEPGVRRPAYKAPEQLYGGELTGAADVFAWAVTMIYASCGRHPFGPDDDPATVTRILRHQPDPGRMSGRLQEIVLRCLVKDSRLRPSAADVVRWLREAGLPLPGASSRRTAPDPLPAVAPRRETRPSESTVGPDPRDAGGVEVHIGGRTARRRARGAARRRAARRRSLLAGMAVGVVAAAALVFVWRSADSVRPSGLVAGGPTGQGQVTRTGPAVQISTAQGDRYRLSAVGWGTEPTVHSASPADGTYLHAEYVLGNPMDRAVLLDIYTADVFVKRDLLPEDARGRCMWQNGVPEDMCMPPARPQVTTRLSGGPPSGGADGDRYMAPGASYVIRVTLDVPVEQDPRPGDLRLYVWKPAYMTDAPVKEVPFPR